jgi:hypothetical protein
LTGGFSDRAVNGYSVILDVIVERELIQTKAAQDEEKVVNSFFYQGAILFGRNTETVLVVESQQGYLDI